MTKYIRIAPFVGLMFLAACSSTNAPHGKVTGTEGSPADSSTTKLSQYVTLSKNAPTLVGVGDTFSYELIATAHAEVSDVIVADEVPEGCSLVSSEPEATKQGKKLVWKFENMSPESSRTIRVTVKAESEGQLQHCATATALPQVCISTMVGKAQLALKKTGPPVVQLGQDATYNITVENTGNAPARNVVVTDTLPDGLRGAEDKTEVSFPIGDLAPGASKAVTVPVKATKRGKVMNTAVAVAGNAAKVVAEAPTSIMLAGVKITKGTKDTELFINRAAAYDIEVSNTGDSPVSGVVVTEQAAQGTIIATAEGATVNGTTATWNIPTLNGGEKQNFVAKVVSKTPGTFTDVASVTTAEGLKDSAQAVTTWKGVTGMLVEFMDETDPIQVGETTKFTVRVTNQGSSLDLAHLNISAALPAELELVAGTCSDEGSIDGRKISWPLIATVGPKASVIRTYIVKAVKSGDARSTVTISDSTRVKGVQQSESTTIY